MSDLLIKNIEMPKQMESPITITIFKNGSVWGNDVTFGKGKLPNAKAIEVPPHGALVDRDEELYQLATSMFPQDMDTTRVVARYRKWLKSAPVVLEANDE